MTPGAPEPGPAPAMAFIKPTAKHPCPTSTLTPDSRARRAHLNVTEIALEKLLCPVPELGSRYQHCQYQVSPARTEVL